MGHVKNIKSVLKEKLQKYVSLAVIREYPIFQPEMYESFAYI